MNRRTFLNLATAASAGTLVSTCSPYATQSQSAPKNILVLGGTNFLGPDIVEHALLRGHTITLFNRGITRP